MDDTILGTDTELPSWLKVLESLVIVWPAEIDI